MIGSSITTNLRSRVSKKDVKLYDMQPIGVIGSSSAGKVCLVCNINHSSYCCPQCYIPFCSSQCYLKHGVECTETFSRQRVKSVLDLEARETIKEDQTASPTAISYGNFRDSDECSHNDRSEQTRIRDQTSSEEDEDDENEYEPYENPDTALVDDTNALSLSALEAGGLDEEEVPVEVNIRNIEKMPSRALARLVKLWTPWWTTEILSESKFDGILSSKKRGISTAMQQIKMTAPKLNTLIDTKKISRDLRYQILGLILGYVVTMHSVNGDWQERVSQETPSENILLGPLEALKLFCFSTPFLDTLFRPSSVVETVGSWVRFRPYPLQDTSRKKIKSLLFDAFSILKYSEFLSFALIEIWLIALSSNMNIINRNNIDEKNENNENNLEISKYIERVLINLEKNDFSSFDDNVLPLMDKYSENFRNKSPSKSKKKKSVISRNENFEFLQSDLLARKTFFLLLYTMDVNRIDVLQDLVVELNEYLNKYID